MNIRENYYKTTLTVRLENHTNLENQLSRTVGGPTTVRGKRTPPIHTEALEALSIGKQVPSLAVNLQDKNHPQDERSPAESTLPIRYV